MSVATEITRLTTAKANLKTAIEAKGVAVPAATKLDGYDDLVAAIPTGPEPEPTSYDGDDTNIYIDNTPSWAPLDLTVWFYLQIGTVYINWGDGTSDQFDRHSGYGNASLSHTYASRGKYKIAVSRSASTNTYGGVGLGETQANQIGDVHSLIVYKLEIGTFSNNRMCSFAGLSRCKRILVSSKIAQGASSWHPFGINAFQLEYLSDKALSALNAGNYGPSYTALSTLVIQDGSNVIGQKYYCESKSLVEVAIPSSVSSIGIQAFYGCTSLLRIAIPDSVTSIGSSAFQSCNTLTDITIGSGIETIGLRAFYVANDYGVLKCSALTCKAVTPPTLASSDVFTNKFATDYTIYVPSGSIEAYEAAANWSAFAGHFQAIPE